jgi:hypothetical protein
MSSPVSQGVNRIDIADLPNGVYIINLLAGSRSHAQRIIVSR